MKKELKERLRYYHIRCTNCDNKILEHPKTKKEPLRLVTKCEDCGSSLNVNIGGKIKIYTDECALSEFFGLQEENEQNIYIKVKFIHLRARTEKELGEDAKKILKIKQPS